MTLTKPPQKKAADASKKESQSELALMDEGKFDIKLQHLDRGIMFSNKKRHLRTPSEGIHPLSAQDYTANNS